MGRRATPWMRSDTGVWYAWHAGRQVSLRLDGQLVRGADRQADAMKAFHRLKADQTGEGRARTFREAPPGMKPAGVAVVRIEIYEPIRASRAVKRLRIKRKRPGRRGRLAASGAG